MAPATVQVPSLGLGYFLGIPYLKQFAKGLTPGGGGMSQGGAKHYGNAAWVSVKLSVPYIKTSSCSMSMCFGLT